MKNNMSLREWLPLAGMTVAAFIFNTSEFMPIGLLSDIAADFRITEAHAGMLISAYSWTVTLLSLPLMLLFSKMEFRKLLLGTIALFCVCQIFSVIPAGFAVLMISRIGVACAHAVFWSIASPIAVRVVSEEHRSFALSMIVTGTSLATILGLPLGRVIGLYIGWRMTFLCVAVVAFIVFLYLTFVFPKASSPRAFSLHQLPQLIKNPLSTGIYLLTFMIVTSYYTAYSYIEPFLKQVAGLKDSWITVALSIFGAAGILGSFLFSRYYDKRRYSFIKFFTVSIAASLILLQPASFSPYAVILLCAFWGMSVTAYNVAFQAEIIKCAPQDASAIAMSIFSAIFNLGIGFGTWIGGITCTYASVSYIGYIGGVLAVAASVYCITKLLKLLKMNGN